MPRLRVVKKPEDSASIPQDQAVQVVLPGESADAPQIEGQEQKKSPELDSGDTAIASIQKQMEDMKRAHEAALEQGRQQVAQAERQRQEAIAQKDREVAKVGQRAEQAELDAILAAMGAAQAESETAQRDLEVSVSNSDTKLMVDAQRRLSRAESRLTQLEDSKIAYEARKEKQAKEPKAQEQAAGDQIEAHIDAMPNLTSTQRQWLKSHRELMTDNKKNVRLQSAHLDAEDAGIRAGSDEYFKFLEEKLGYRKPEEDEDDMAYDKDNMENLGTGRNMERNAGTAAPPSRESRSMGSGQPNNNRITLSPEQREAARNAGIDEVTYAQQLVKFNSLKKDGYFGH